VRCADDVVGPVVHESDNDKVRLCLCEMGERDILTFTLRAAISQHTSDPMSLPLTCRPCLARTDSATRSYRASRDTKHVKSVLGQHNNKRLPFTLLACLNLCSAHTKHAPTPHYDNPPPSYPHPKNYNIVIFNLILNPSIRST
jgi:hypothetical protein